MLWSKSTTELDNRGYLNRNKILRTFVDLDNFPATFFNYVL